MTALILIAFAVAFALDFADTAHKLAIESRSPARAALWSVAMYLLGLVSLWAALDVSAWLVLPTCAGLAVGSVVAVRRAR
jgi:quinol-cytochrome oxidoreductase complex cytochrome b subunit